MADVGDDVADGTVFDVVLEVRRVETDGKFLVEGFGLDAAGFALDEVFDLADDAFAGEDASLGRVDGGRRRNRLGEFSGESHRATDGACDAVEGDCKAWEGDVRRRGGVLGLIEFILGFGLLVKQAGEVGADLDEFVQDAAVVLPLFRKKIGFGFRFG